LSPTRRRSARLDDHDKQAESLTSSTGGSADEWKFDFHGYFRGPLRSASARPTPANLPTPRRRRTRRAPAPPVPGTQWHSPDARPRLQLPGLELHQHGRRPWTQLNFSYGNSRAMATVIVDSYAVTDGGYKHLQAQQGIDQAFLTLNFPEALGDLGTLTWNLGTFQNRYGTMGKYDGGMYETYIIGRTHVTGETLTANLTNLDNAGNWSISLEHGFGAKYDIIPFLNNQYYQIFTNVRSVARGAPYLADRDAEYLPYAGPVPQGSTFLHHAHLGAKYQKLWTFGLHYLYTWTPDDNWHPVNSRSDERRRRGAARARPDPGQHRRSSAPRRARRRRRTATATSPTRTSTRATSTRSPTRWRSSTRAAATTSSRTSSAALRPAHRRLPGPQNETGTVDNIALQYSFSFGALARYPEDWWGDGPDLVLTGVRHPVDRRQPAPSVAVNATRARIVATRTRADWNMSTKKLKFGMDAVYTPLYWLGFNGRFDWVQPDLDAAYARTRASRRQRSVVRRADRAPAVPHAVRHARDGAAAVLALLPGDAAYPSYPYAWVAKADATWWASSLRCGGNERLSYEQADLLRLLGGRRGRLLRFEPRRELADLRRRGRVVDGHAGTGGPARAARAAAAPGTGRSSDRRSGRSTRAWTASRSARTTRRRT
jgi:hypothetical protein